MEPIDFKERTTILAKNQPQYKPLPVKMQMCAGYPVTSCWKLSFRERIKLLFTGKLWLQQLTFGTSFQPQLPMVDKPDW